MGHYASEMACSTCGQVRCVCPSQPNLDLLKWMVDPSTFEVMKVADFDKKYQYVQHGNGMVITGSPYLRRMSSTLFGTEKEALDHRMTVIDEQIAFHRKVIVEHTSKINQLIDKRIDIANE